MLSLKLKNDLKIIKTKLNHKLVKGMDDNVKSFKSKRDKLMGRIKATRANIVQEQRHEVDLAASIVDDDIRAKKRFKMINPQPLRPKTIKPGR